MNLSYLVNNQPQASVSVQWRVRCLFYLSFWELRRMISNDYINSYFCFGFAVNNVKVVLKSPSNRLSYNFHVHFKSIIHKSSSTESLVDLERLMKSSSLMCWWYPPFVSDLMSSWLLITYLGLIFGWLPPVLPWPGLSSQARCLRTWACFRWIDTVFQDGWIVD